MAAVMVAIAFSFCRFVSDASWRDEDGTAPSGFGKAAWSLSEPKRLTQSFYAAIVASLDVVVTSFRHTPFLTAPTAAPALSAFPQFLRRLRPPPAWQHFRSKIIISYVFTNRVYINNLHLKTGEIANLY